MPPAVLPFASLSVGFGGPPQLGVMFSRRTSPATIATRRVIEFIEASMRGTARRRSQGMNILHPYETRGAKIPRRLRRWVPPMFLWHCAPAPTPGWQTTRRSRRGPLASSLLPDCCLLSPCSGTEGWTIRRLGRHPNPAIGRHLKTGHRE